MATPQSSVPCFSLDFKGIGLQESYPTSERRFNRLRPGYDRITSRRGGYMAKGICTKCNKTKMCAMMSKDNAEKAIKEGAKKSF